jgi:hypothetical protein
MPKLVILFFRLIRPAYQLLPEFFLPGYITKKRMYPSPFFPKMVPGVRKMFFSIKNISINVSEDRFPKGNFAHTNMPTASLLKVQPSFSAN